MVATTGIERAIQYYHAISDYLQERKSRYQALVAFSGEHESGGARVSEASLNGLPSAQIAERFQEDPYRFLVCADKFQTGYDEPLLHTMYVDKTLSGIKAVQTLSRLNRGTPRSTTCSCSTLSTLTPSALRSRTSIGDDSGRRDRPQQAARPAGGSGSRPSVFRGAGRRVRAPVHILRTFNEHFGDIRWDDADRVQQLITETIPAASPRTPPSATPARTPTPRTPASSTTRRCCA